MKKLLEKEEKKVTEALQTNQSVINQRFMENKEKEIILQSALEIDQPDHFLQVTTLDICFSKAHKIYYLYYQ